MTDTVTKLSAHQSHQVFPSSLAGCVLHRRAAEALEGTWDPSPQAATAPSPHPYAQCQTPLPLTVTSLSPRPLQLRTMRVPSGTVGHSLSR